MAFAQFPSPGGLPSDVDGSMVLTLWPSPAAFEWPARRRLKSVEVRRIAMRISPGSESAGDILGRSQWRLDTGYFQNRAERRKQPKNRS